MRHIIIRSKMKKGKPLINDPIISSHVPETDWFSISSYQRMFGTYPSVYIKPDVGRRGNGIIRLKKLNDWESEVSYEQTSIRCPTNEVMVKLNKILHPKKKYIIQQGIELATYHHRPFDVRIVLQKPLNRWQVTWISAKVAAEESSVVTNIAKGAKDVKFIKTLKGADQRLDVFEIQRELIDVSHQIVQILASHFPLNIIGLDMAIDKRGKIWFIEANTNPDFRGLKSFDRKQYQRYLKAKKLIRKG